MPSERPLEELLEEARETYAVFGRADKALTLVDEVLLRAPECVEALNLRAAVLYELDRDDESRAAHQRALALEPDSTEALHGLAALENDGGNYAAARKLAQHGREAAKRDPHPDMRENEDHRQRVCAQLYVEEAFALWYEGEREEATELLSETGPRACPLEVETFEDELAWLEEHPDNPDV